MLLSVLEIEMDTDGSGAIDFDEFAAWWKHGLTAGKAKTQMALLRLKLRGQSLVKKITGGKIRHCLEDI